MTTPNPTAEQIEAVLMFAERGYLRELGAIDPRHQYSEDEAAEQKRRFENYREGVAALRARNMLSEGAPSEEQFDGAWGEYHDRSVPDARSYPSFSAGWDAALMAMGVAPQPPVNEVATSSERVKNGGNSLHVAPQEPSASDRDTWLCGKCEREKMLGRDDGQIAEHHRTCSVGMVPTPLPTVRS